MPPKSEIRNYGADRRWYPMIDSRRSKCSESAFGKRTAIQHGARQLT